MKSKILNLFLLVSISLIFSCKNNSKPKEDISVNDAAPIEKTEGIATIYNLNPGQSRIDWVGSKFVGQHNGTIAISAGRLNIVEGNITSGDIDIDMRGIVVKDLKGEEKTELEDHLKNKDFFEADKYPLGRFVITKVEKIENNPKATHQVTGDLTMKEITNSVSFPATINMFDNGISATSEPFTINRTKWKIVYSSTILGIAMDKAVKDDIQLKINIVAIK
jgi:polyisoprenoid-binding protein YceI